MTQDDTVNLLQTLQRMRQSGYPDEPPKPITWVPTGEAETVFLILFVVFAIGLVFFVLTMRTGDYPEPVQRTRTRRPFKRLDN